MARFAIASVLSALALFTVSASPQNARGAEGINWVTSVANARKVAKEENRPIVMFVTAKWCGYCKKMEKTTFTNSAVARTMKTKFVPLFIDADEHEALVAKLKIDGFPTMLVFGPDGNLIDRNSGYLAPAEAQEWLEKAIP